MVRTVRYYVFEEGGEIKRIPRRISEALSFGKDAIPAYAGTRQRVLEVIVRNRSGKPQMIEQAGGFYFDFDADGRIDKGLARSIVAAMDDAEVRPKSSGNVVPLSSKRGNADSASASKWQPNPRDLDRVLADILGTNPSGPFPSVVGVAARRPSLTHDARSVISDLRSTHSMWNWQIRQLSEGALPGFISEARKQAEAEPENQFIWEAIAAEGQRQLGLQRQRRTGKGEWVAVVQMFTHENFASMEETFVEHRVCDGEQAAIEALKAMVIEHQAMVGKAMSIEAKTMPALEWKLRNGAPY
jgi:hypothetical protein